MSKYLCSTNEIWRADSEGEAVQLINEAKAAGEYILKKYTSEKKEIKAKGEVIDEYYKVTLTKEFNDLKEPDTTITVDYNID